MAAADLTSLAHRTLHVKTAITIATLLWCAIPSFCYGGRPDGATSPNGKREIVVSDTPRKGVRGEPIIVRELSPPRIIDIVGFLTADDSSSVTSVHWNSRSDCFVLQGSGYRGGFMKLFAITDRGVVERSFPSLFELNVNAIDKLKQFQRDHAHELGEPVGFPGGGWSFIRWVEADSFEMRHYSSQQLGLRRVGWDYTVTLKVSGRNRSVTAIKVKEIIGYLDETSTTNK